MIEYILLGIVGAIIISIGLTSMQMGKYISTLSTPSSGGLPWFSKPIPATKLTFIITMILYIGGCIGIFLYNGEKIVEIIGIASVTFAFMISITTVLLSGAVIRVINNKRS